MKPSNIGHGFLLAGGLFAGAGCTTLGMPPPSEHSLEASIGMDDMKKYLGRVTPALEPRYFVDLSTQEKASYAFLSTGRIVIYVFAKNGLGLEARYASNREDSNLDEILLDRDGTKVTMQQKYSTAPYGGTSQTDEQLWQKHVDRYVRLLELAFKEAKSREAGEILKERELLKNK